MFTLMRFPALGQHAMGRLAIAALAATLALAALWPGKARADDDVVRVIVEAADVVFRSGDPYYRHGSYGYGDRLIVARDRYGRPVYYRTVPRGHYSGDYRSVPPYGNAHGYWKQQQRRVSCDRNGRCVSRYYDPRYDRRHERRDWRRGYGQHPYRTRYGYQDRYRDRYGYWDGHRWRSHGD